MTDEYYLKERCNSLEREIEKLNKEKAVGEFKRELIKWASENFFTCADYDIEVISANALLDFINKEK